MGVLTNAIKHIVTHNIPKDDKLDNVLTNNTQQSRRCIDHLKNNINLKGSKTCTLINECSKLINGIIQVVRT